jgi:hypothetical protein
MLDPWKIITAIYLLAVVKEVVGHIITNITEDAATIYHYSRITVVKENCIS